MRRDGCVCAAQIFRRPRLGLMGLGVEGSLGFRVSGCGFEGAGLSGPDVAAAPAPHSASGETPLRLWELNKKRLKVPGLRSLLKV